MIHVLATIKLKDGAREAFLAEFHRLVATVCAEAGCLEYGPAIDISANVPAQPPLRENVVVVVEKWESLEALQAHLAAPHMQEYRTRVKEFVLGVQLQVLQPA